MNAHQIVVSIRNSILVVSVLLSGCTKQAPVSSEQAEDFPPATLDVAQLKVPTEIDFNKHIRPIISDRCFACHGPDAYNQESPFRLDSEENAQMNLGKEDEPARFGIVPGNPDASQMIKRIMHEDPNERMPPPAANKKKITETELATLKKWISEGAQYEPHWAFVPPINLRPPSPQSPTGYVTPSTPTC